MDYKRVFLINPSSYKEEKIKYIPKIIDAILPDNILAFPQVNIDPLRNSPALDINNIVIVPTNRKVRPIVRL